MVLWFSEARAALEGRDIIQGCKRHSATVHPKTSGPFARLLGVHVVSESDAGVELRVDAGSDHEREGGIVHGGVMMSILDMAMAGSVARTLDAGQTTASVSITTDFLRPASAGPLTARGRLERRGKTMAFPVGELVDAEGKLVARATGVWAIRPASDR